MEDLQKPDFEFKNSSIRMSEDIIAQRNVLAPIMYVCEQKLKAFLVAEKYVFLNLHHI